CRIYGSVLWLAHMKTTIELDDELLRAAKQRAAASGQPLRAFIEDALRARLLPRPRGRSKFKLDVPVIKGKAPPAIDIADRNALYDLMERE
ncbi:MAG TPA: type II toxin-antitoxin system VapB family antitoxin, partial [Gammaproteobacteria bacterium]|nr:type II toxin-antitoxin system VapB family antitoxin [Gammaproteobacteria bacterium]